MLAFAMSFCGSTNSREKIGTAHCSLENDDIKFCYGQAKMIENAMCGCRFFKSREKNLHFQKYLDTCGQAKTI